MSPGPEAHVAAVVQARMSSARLPGKVLADIGGRPALALLLDRLERAREPDSIMLATSVDPRDDPIQQLGEARGMPVLRGPLDDVLERYRLAADLTGCDAVARLTGDCPLLDPAVVDHVIGAWRTSGEAYVTNSLEPRTYPDGMDVEVISRDALIAAATEASTPEEREHVTSYLVARPERFTRRAVHMEPARGEVRMVLDTQADLDLLRLLVERAGPRATLEELLAALP